MTTPLLFFAGLFLAYANGANDNLKGVATLLGSRTLGMRGALAWGTLTTLLGSLAALLLSAQLLAAFSGRGVVPDELVGDPSFLLATGLAAALVVMAATLRGLPVSTTHALVGGLAGAGVASAGLSGVAWPHLATSFALPLLLSPAAAAILVAIGYPRLHRLRERLGVKSESCLCVGTELVAVGAVGPTRFAQGASVAVPAREMLTAGVGTEAECVDRYRGRLLGVSTQRVLDGAHALSAGAVGFARGLNDTPKVAAILLASGGTSSAWALGSVGAGMAVGALLQARKVGRTMSFDITPMNAGQGLTANLATSALVIGASRLGMPVSTTHVSIGALIGLGAATDGLARKTVKRILWAWVATLPAAFACAAIVFTLLS